VIHASSNVITERDVTMKNLSLRKTLMIPYLDMKGQLHFWCNSIGIPSYA